MRRLTWLLFGLFLATALLYWRFPRQTVEIARRLEPVGGPKAIPGLQFVRVFSDLTFEQPLFLTFAPGQDDAIYVVTQPGLIQRVKLNAGRAAAEVFRDLRSRVRAEGEEGLLGLAFDPEYAANGYFYVYYTPRSLPRRTVIERLSAKDQSSTTLLTIPQPYANHNGGWIAFGPDGKLYAGVGDGGAANDPDKRAQNLSELLGKILRLDTRGDAPADNPFAGRKDARAEIWAYGLRNPWRGSFDRFTGDLWIGDVGQNDIEEIDRVVKGGNYGWPQLEGNRPNGQAAGAPAASLPPVFQYDHRYGCSVTGGYVYHGERVPAAAGRYFFADFCSGRVWMLDPGPPVKATHFATVPSPSSFGEDADGELYITSYDGHIYQLAP